MQIEFKAADGTPLAGYWFDAQTTDSASAPGQAKGTVLVNPGTATKTLFYRRFCEYLQANGYQVLLWNYRVFCESRQQPLQQSDYRFSDIGRLDIPAAIAEAKRRTPAGLPLFCVGHSAGGQQFGFADNVDQVQGLVAVASSAGYFANMPLGYRLKAHFFFKLFGPLSHRLTGYVAAGRFGFMEDLPTSLASEWHDWCKEPDLFFAPSYYGKTVAEGAYKAMPMPVHVIHASDDEIASAANVANFWRHIKGVKGISFQQYPATGSPNRKIGHFGYFHSANRFIWEDILQQLEQWRLGMEV